MWLPLMVIKCNLVWFNMLQYNFLSRFFSEDSGIFTLNKTLLTGNLFQQTCWRGKLDGGERLPVFFFQNYQTNVVINKFKYAASYIWPAKKVNKALLLVCLYESLTTPLAQTLKCIAGRWMWKRPKINSVKVDLFELFLGDKHRRNTDKV